MGEQTDYATHPGHKCPRCDSPAPHLHPAIQCGGEVQPCTDPYHSIRTPENAPYVDKAGERLGIPVADYNAWIEAAKP